MALVSRSRRVLLSIHATRVPDVNDLLTILSRTGTILGWLTIRFVHESLGADMQRIIGPARGFLAQTGGKLAGLIAQLSGWAIFR